jgi:hypothetical protein
MDSFHSNQPFYFLILRSLEEPHAHIHPNLIEPYYAYSYLFSLYLFRFHSFCWLAAYLVFDDSFCYYYQSCFNWFRIELIAAHFLSNYYSSFHKIFEVHCFVYEIEIFYPLVSFCQKNNLFKIFLFNLKLNFFTDFKLKNLYGS